MCCPLRRTFGLRKKMLRPLCRDEKNVMLMRTLRVFVLSCVLACATPLLRAQDGAGDARFGGMRYAPQFQMDLALGANTDLAKSSSNPASRLFGTRPGTVPAFDVRISHLFAPRFGWYADLRVKFFKGKMEYATLGDKVADALADVFFPGMDRLHLAYSVGGVYRMEGLRWRCYPRVGVGQSHYGTNRESSATVGERRTVVETDGKAWCMDFGVSTQYRLTPQVALVLDVLYQQPITKCKGYMLVDDGSSAPQEYAYRSRTLGRELNVSLGVNFSLDLRKR